MRPGRDSLLDRGYGNTTCLEYCVPAAGLEIRRLRDAETAWWPARLQSRIPNVEACESSVGLHEDYSVPNGSLRYDPPVLVEGRPVSSRAARSVICDRTGVDRLSTCLARRRSPAAAASRGQAMLWPVA